MYRLPSHPAGPVSRSGCGQCLHHVQTSLPAWDFQDQEPGGDGAACRCQDPDSLQDCEDEDRCEGGGQHFCSQCLVFCCYAAIRYRFGYNIDPRDFQEANYYVIESGKHSLWVALLALFFV